MSLYNYSENSAQLGESWKKYEMGVFEPFSVSGKKENTEFTALQVKVVDDADFIPLGVCGGEKDALKTVEEKTAVLEQEAYEKGFAQGEKDGFELGEKRAIKVTENIEKIFEGLKSLKLDMLKQYEKEILDLIFSIAEKVVHHQINSKEESVKDAIFKALNLVVEKSQVVFRVNPDDYDLVEKLRPELFSKHNDLKSITVNSDPCISRGGCLLETVNGDVDATVETQLETIYQCLTSTFAEREDD
jgi:flagellar biosynthesis/type III secretory pathway protein FliH